MIKTPPRRTAMAAIAGCLIGSAIMANAEQPSEPDAQAIADLTAERAEQPVELGAVRWMRDFEAATQHADNVDRPMLVLFDEVPGCHTCVRYGDVVLSHPLIVEAAESLFVPVAVYNNVDGDDRDVLDSFNEPTWNNPVVRIIDHDRTPRAPRLNGDYTVHGLAHTMVTALEAPPQYLQHLAAAHAYVGKPTDTATFAMHCFWDGEARLATIDGVVASAVGFLDGHEVVEVEFIPEVVSYERLLNEAIRLECAHHVYARTDAQYDAAIERIGRNVKRSDEPITRSEKDELYRVRHSTYRGVPMTWRQAAYVNAAISDGAIPDEHLSPRQRAMHLQQWRYKNVKWPVRAGDDANIVDGWNEAVGMLVEMPGQ